MFPQLLYVYVHRLRNCFEQQDFCFTNDFNIWFTEGNLLIAPRENSSIIKNIANLTKGLSNKYSIIFTYDFEKNIG